MTKGMRWTFLLFIMFCVVLGVYAQQQFGQGGSAVTIAAALPSGTNVIGKFTTDQTTHGTTDLIAADNTKIGGTAIATGTGTANAGTQRVAVASDSTIGINTAIPAGTNAIGVTYPLTNCGTTKVETGSPAGLVALPTVATAAFTSTTCVLQMVFANTSNTTAYTLTVTDNAGTPIPFLNAVTINPLESRLYNCPNGCKFNAGLKWNASNVAVTGYINGLQ